MNKPALQKIAKYAFSFLIIFFIVFLTRNQWGNYQEILNLPLDSFIYLSALFLTMQLVLSRNLLLLLRVFDIKISILESYKLISLQTFYNYLPLNAGTIYNAAYLKKKKGFSINRFVSIASLNIVIMASTFGVCGLIAILVNFLYSKTLDPILILYSSIFVLGGVVFYLLIFLPKINSNNRLLKWISGVREGWETMSQRPVVILQVILNDILILGILALRFFIIFRFLNSGISLIAILFITIMTTLIRFNSIFPGNLGLRESIVGGMSKSFGIDFNIGFIAGIIDRIVAIIWIFIFGFLFHFQSLKKSND